MSEASERLTGSTWDVERLLGDALRPIEPPERLSGRFEDTLAAVTQAAAEELSDWAEELSESELRALRDPRNWVRPVVAVGAGGIATGALVLLELRRRGRQQTKSRLRSVTAVSRPAACASMEQSRGAPIAGRANVVGIDAARCEAEDGDGEVERAEPDRVAARGEAGEEQAERAGEDVEDVGPAVDGEAGRALRRRRRGGRTRSRRRSRRSRRSPAPRRPASRRAGRGLPRSIGGDCRLPVRDGADLLPTPRTARRGVSCSNCGRPICPDCMTPTPVGMRCPECARERTRVTRGAVGPGRYDTPRRPMS